MNIFIACSSRDEIDLKYFKSALEVGNLLKNNYNLVFGGYNHGLMGIFYKTFKDNGNIVTGISVQKYEDEFMELYCDCEYLAKTVNERTDEIINQSDAFLFMPGGIGTIYEFFSCLEEKRTNNLDKPIIIYNEFNFFDNMLNLLDNIYKSNFADQNDADNYIVVNNKEELKNVLDNLKEKRKISGRIYNGKNR